MLNQVVIVGRLTADPEVNETEGNKKVCHATVAVGRSFKNVEGIYETDFIRCTLWNGVAENTCEYCKKGDVVGVKGRLQTSNYESKDGKKYLMEVIAEKITFLSSKKPSEEEQE